MKILVLGLGNDLYGDDGVGIHAVRVLRNEWSHRGRTRGKPSGRGRRTARVDFVECALSGIAVLDVIRGYDALVIVDTIMRPEPVTGRVHLLEASDVRDVPGPSPHYVSIPQTIALGTQLGVKMPKILKIVGVEANTVYRLGEDLSEEMKRRLPEIVGRTREVLIEWLSGAVRRISP